MFVFIMADSDSNRSDAHSMTEILDVLVVGCFQTLAKNRTGFIYEQFTEFMEDLRIKIFDNKISELVSYV